MMRTLFQFSFVSFCKINLLQVRSLTRMAGKFQAIAKGVPNSKDFRVFFSKSSEILNFISLTFST